MPIPVQSYLWTRVQTAVGLWVERVTGLPASAPSGTPATPARVVWSTYDIAQVPKPFVSLQRINAWSEGYPNEYLTERALQTTVTITTNTAGEAVRLWLAFAEIEVIVQAGQSITDVRDALLAVLQQQAEPLVYAASGVDAIVITPKGTQVVNVVALLGCTAVDDIVETVSVREVPRKYLVRVQVYGGPGDGDDSIDEYVDTLLLSLRTKDVITSFTQYGVAVQGVPETANDVSAISGALQERRAFFDVTFAATSVSYVRDPASVDEVAEPEVIGLEQAS